MSVNEDLYDLYDKHPNQDILKNFTLDDYFKCTDTKLVIIDEWNRQFYEDLEQPITNYFHTIYNDLTLNKYNILRKLHPQHINDLFDLIQYHVEKNYTTEIFDKYPEYAEPLIFKYNSQKNKLKNKKVKIWNISTSLGNKTKKTH